MNETRTVVFVTTRNTDLAQTLVRLLYANGIDAFWVTEEEDRKLGEAWIVSGRMRDVDSAWRN